MATRLALCTFSRNAVIADMLLVMVKTPPFSIPGIGGTTGSVPVAKTRRS